MTSGGIQRVPTLLTKMVGRKKYRIKKSPKKLHLDEATFHNFENTSPGKYAIKAFFGTSRAIRLVASNYSIGKLVASRIFFLQYFDWFLVPFSFCSLSISPALSHLLLAFARLLLREAPIQSQE